MPTWNIIMIEDGVGLSNQTCTNDIRANLQRLLCVKESRNILHKQDETADIHLIANYFPERYENEIAFIRKMKTKGKKTVAIFGADNKWICGAFLLGENQTKSKFINYSDLADEVDYILSEMNPSWQVFGRNQNKVIPLSDPLEKFNFPIKNNKDIDFLLVGANALGGLCYSIELAKMLKGQYKCVLGVRLEMIDKLRKSYPDLAFEVTGPHDVFLEYLARAKVVINLELKARGGRVLQWSYYADVPCVGSEGAFWSQLFPAISFNKFDLIDICNKAKYAIDNSEELLITAKELAKPFYFPEWIKTVYAKLGL